MEGDAGTVPEARLVRSHSGARVGRRFDEVDDLDAVDVIAAGLGGRIHAVGAGCEHVGDDEAVICVLAAVTH